MQVILRKVFRETVVKKGGGGGGYRMGEWESFGEFFSNDYSV